jgi:hypothetical protein
MAMLFPDPFDALLSFQQALDTFRASSWLGSGPSASGTYPPLNVFRKGDDLVVIAEVPGIRKEDLQIKSRAIRSVSPGPRLFNTARTPRFIGESVSPGPLTGRSRFPWKSMPIRSRPNAAMECWPFTCHEPSGTSPNRSQWDERPRAQNLARDGGHNGEVAGT